jgi:hypothetical protein
MGRASALEKSLDSRSLSLAENAVLVAGRLDVATERNRGRQGCRGRTGRLLQNSGEGDPARYHSIAHSAIAAGARFVAHDPQ